MNKILTKVATLALGAAMAVGVGVAVGSKKASEAKAAASLAATFTCGEDGSASHNDGTSATTYSETKSGYTLSVTDGVKFYTGARDATGKGCFKFGTSSAVGSMKFTAPSDVVLVKIYVAGYKANSAKISVNSGTAQTISTTSNSGQYTAVDVDTSSSKSVSFTTASGGVRAMINTIEFYTEGASTDHTVTDSVSDGTISPSSVADGGTLTATITPDTWYSVPTSVSVTMGGAAVTHTYSNGVVTVQNVTGDIEISGSCVKTGGPAHAGTLADPYTIADAYMAIDASKATSGVYVQGIVSGIVTPWSSEHSNISFNISVDGETTGNQLQFYRCSSSTQHEITSDADIEVGATVIGFGNLTKYNSTYEYGQGCTVVSYTAPTSSALSNISLGGTYQTTFDVSDEFSYEGLVVTAHYEDSTSKEVTPTSVSTPDMTTAGQKTVTVSYTEKEVTKSETYSITVNAVTLYTMSFNPGSGSGTMESVQVKEGADYTLPACTFTAPTGMTFDAWTYVGTRMTQVTDVHDDYEFTAIWKLVTDVTDTLNNANTINKVQTSYESWTTETMDSGAVYSGQSAGDKTSIQLRSNNSNSGVVSSTSGGNLISVTITFNTETAATRTVQVYGKTSSYSNPTELYNDSTKGTLVGEANIDNGSSQTIEVDGDYQYVGIRSKSGALYIEEIKVVWEAAPVTPKVLTEISVENPQIEYEVGDAFVYPKVVAHYDDESSKYVTTATFTNDSTAVAGDFVVGVSYSENAITRETSYNITVSEPAPVETKTYKKVKTNLANFAGDYLIVYEEGSVAFDGSLENPDVTSNTFAVSIADETISASEAYEFTVAKKEGGYSLKSAYGLYIGKTANSNGMDKNANDNYTNTISYLGTEESDMDIVGSGLPHLRYNASSGQERFRFFKSDSYTGQKAVSLYIEVANDAEAFALDILNLTTEVCSAEGEHATGDFATAWSTLTTKYDSVVNKDLLVEGEAEANGTFFAEALARYDILVAKYGLNPFMTGRVSNLAYIPNYQSNIDSSSSITIIVIVAVASMTLLGVTLVLRKRKHQ